MLDRAVPRAGRTKRLIYSADAVGRDARGILKTSGQLWDEPTQHNHCPRLEPSILTSTPVPFCCHRPRPEGVGGGGGEREDIPLGRQEPKLLFSPGRPTPQSERLEKPFLWFYFPLTCSNTSEERGHLRVFWNPQRLGNPNAVTTPTPPQRSV